MRLLNNTQRLNALLCLHKSDSWGGMGDQPPPSHAWSRLLIADVLQEACARDQIIEAVVMSLGEAILFFRRHSHNDGLLYRNVKGFEVGLRGSFN